MVLSAIGKKNQIESFDSQPMKTAKFNSQIKRTESEMVLSDIVYRNR